MRSAILLLPAQNPPARFRQMPGDRRGRLAMALAFLQPLIKLTNVLLAVFVPVHDGGICGLDKSPFQVMVGLRRGWPVMRLAAAGMHARNQTRVSSQVHTCGEPLHISYLQIKS